MPSHSGLESELVNPKTSITPYISHAVAWGYMVLLGAKRGALQKGLVQGHERADVAAVRTTSVGMWILLMTRMFVHRAVDVEAAKKFMPVLKDAAVKPFAGNESKFIKGLNLWKAKEEDPND
jgi:hypothetical protein